MAALITFCLRRSHNLGKLFNPHRHQAVQKYLPLIETSRCVAAVPDRKKQLRLRIHWKLDRDFGVSTYLFNSFLSTLEEGGPLTETDLALLLHICGSGPFDASSSARLKYAEDLWSRVTDQSVQPTSKLYNMKLKAYCLNDKTFSPFEELAAMKSLGVCPDKITYGLLIEAFCRNGDIAGANFVLEAMNAAGLMVGLPVFNSFITCHLKAGSPNEASQVLETIRSRGLVPNFDTYYRFVQHYAEEGDIDSVFKYIQEAESQSQPLDPQVLIKVYRLMLHNGHGNKANQIVPMLKEKDVFRSYTMQNICQLVAEGFHEEAVKLFLEIPKTLTENDHDGHFLLRCMLENNINAKDIFKVAERLSEDLPHTKPLIEALFRAYKMNKHEIGVKLLDEMVSQNHTLTVPMLLPVICHYRDVHDVEGLYKTVERILSLDHCEQTIDALDAFCYPALEKMGQSKEDILTKMKEHASQWNTFFMIKEIKAGRWAAALETAQKPLDDNFVEWIDNNRYVLLSHQCDNNEARFKLVAKLIKKNKLNRSLALVMIKFNVRADDLESAHSLLDILRQEDVRVPRTTSFEQAPQDIQDKLSGLNGRRPLDDFGKMSREELEQVTKRMPHYVTPHILLLNKAVAGKNLPGVQKHLSELKALNFSFQKNHLTDVIHALANLGDVNAALEYFKELQERFEMKYEDTVPLSLAVMLVREGDIQGALEMIDTAQKIEISPKIDEIRIRKIIALLNLSKTVEEAESIHDALVKGRKYVGNEARVAHYYYMKKVVEGCDDKDLLQKLETLKDRYWVFPCMDDIISRFIKKEDIESLKKVMDIGIGVVGSNLFHHKLACNFIVCGMPSKAAAIFEKMGNKLHTIHLAKSCKYFIKKKQVKHVETLVQIVKSLPISRTAMLEQLMEAYLSENALDKAVEVLELFDSEFLVPKRSSLDSLVTAFNINKKEHPEILKAFLSRLEIVDKTKPEEYES